MAQVGEFARSIETGWIGLITDIDSEEMCEMKGVNFWGMTFEPPTTKEELETLLDPNSKNNHFDHDDIQWFHIDDVDLMDKYEVFKLRGNV